MRRKEREITDLSLMTDILGRAPVCRIAMVDNGLPYVVPVNFGYADRTIFIHGASDGRKFGILRKGGRICFEVTVDTELRKGEKACDWGYRYRSVIGWGTVSVIEDSGEKRAALDVIMNHYEKGSYSYADAQVKGIAIFRIDIDEMSGKQCGY